MKKHRPGVNNLLPSSTPLKYLSEFQVREMLARQFIKDPETRKKWREYQRRHNSQIASMNKGDFRGPRR